MLFGDSGLVVYLSPMLPVPSISDFRALLKLALPIVVVQVGLMMMGVVDTIIVGHVSATELAAAAIGNLYYFGLTMFGMGTLMAIDPIVSQAFGARDEPAIARGLQRGMVLALIISVPVALLCLPAEPILRAFRQPPEVVPRAAGFALMSAPGVPAFFAWMVLRLALQSMKKMRPVLITMIVANLVNAALNWVFVFGNLGAPAMGAVGSALGSTIGRYVMVMLLLAMSWGDLRRYFIPWRPESFQRGPLMRTLAIGTPIGVQISLEFGAFAVIALLAGWFGAEAIAGHQIAINFASLTFMVPMGVGSAAAVLVGHAVGANDPLHARRVASTALACGIAFMLLTATAMLTLPGVIAGIYTSSPGVAAVAATLIPIAGVFQVFDGIQVVSAGILRGVGDTRAPMLINVLAFWLVGMPVSLWLGFRMNAGVVGLWWGFVAGLAAVSVLLVLRVRHRMRGALERVKVDPATAALDPEDAVEPPAA